MKFEFDNKRPIYLQLFEILKNEIISGGFEPGQKLPSVRELSLMAQVNPNTLQKALGTLKQEGLIHTRRTSGKFITEDQKLIRTLRLEKARQMTEAYYLQMRSLGLSSQDIQEMLTLCEANHESAGMH